jgi:hypothetical protein
MPIAPRLSAKTDRPSSTISGVATKKIWNCGITRPTRPVAMLKISENTTTGAASCRPSAKDLPRSDRQLAGVGDLHRRG